MRQVIERAARVGHLATGFVYLIVGGVALVAAIDTRRPALDAQGALQIVLTGPVGDALLMAVAAGLAADFVWQLVRATTNADLAPPSVIGIANRVGWVMSGFVHVGLAFTAAKLALDLPQDTAEHQAKASAAAVMTVPSGWVALMAAGVVIVLVGVHLLHRAIVGDVDRWLDVFRLGRRLSAAILWLGRFGLAMRAVVFCAGGILLARAALQHRPWAARGLGGTLTALESIPYGGALLALVGAGFVAFGIVELASARYRIIRVPTSAEPATSGDPARDREAVGR